MNLKFCTILMKSKNSVFGFSSTSWKFKIGKYSMELQEKLAYKLLITLINNSKPKCQNFTKN